MPASGTEQIVSTTATDEKTPLCAPGTPPSTLPRAPRYKLILVAFTKGRPVTLAHMRDVVLADCRCTEVSLVKFRDCVVEVVLNLINDKTPPAYTACFSSREDAEAARALISRRKAVKGIVVHVDPRVFVAH
jgi:hypothetical protein